MVRDKLLVLAGVTAAEMGLDEISAVCRQKVLSHNGRHIVRRWPNMRRALADDRFQTYLKQLRRRYTPEKAEHMLSALGIELARERELYLNDHEYAAALLKTTPDAGATLSPHDKDAMHRAIGRRLAAPVFQRGSARAWLYEWGPFAVGIGALVCLAVASASGR